MSYIGVLSQQRRPACWSCSAFAAFVGLRWTKDRTGFVGVCTYILTQLRMLSIESKDGAILNNALVPKRQAVNKANHEDH